MPFDTVVANAGRLRILTRLAADGDQEFVRLRKATQLTDGNLASHARRLITAGLITAHKSFRDGKPLTTFTLTEAGRAALEQHARHLLAALGQGGELPPMPHGAIDAEPALIPAVRDDEWVD